MLALFALKKESEGPLTISALVTTEGKTEQVDCMWSNAGELCLFLPGYTDLSQVRLQVSGEGQYRLGEQPLENGMSCADFVFDYPYSLTDAAGELPFEISVRFVRSGGVDTLFLDVASGSMESIHASKENQERGSLRWYSPDGQLEYLGNLDAVSGRGHSSWNENKKSYNLELSSAADLLNMGSAQKWVLQANAMDTTELRNKIVYDSAEAVGLAYSPDCNWVDLYLNGEYAGLYLLCERNEVHTERVDISREDSFLVAKDWEWRFQEQGKPYILTEGNVALRVHYADMDLQTLQAVWQSAENAILAEDGIDPVTGKSWLELIDLESWVKKYLIEEVFANLDGTALSQFYYYDGSSESGKIYAGPVWDYDLTMGNGAAEPNMFFGNRYGIYGSPWPNALYQKEEFYSEVKEQYVTVFRPMLQQLLEGGIAEYASRVEQAAAMSQLRWYGADTAARTEEMLAYMTQRMEFLDSLWIEEQEYCLVQVYGYGGAVNCYAVEPGGSMPVLQEYESNETTTFYGWQYKDLWTPVDFDRPVYEDTEIVLVYEDNPQPAEEAVQQPAEPAEEIPLYWIMPLMCVCAILVVMIFAEIRRTKRNGGNADA